MKTQTITAPSDQVRDAFARWIAGLGQVRLVVLEGITKAGKTTIVEQSFVASDGSLSTNIRIDDFLPPSGTVSPEASFLDVLDRTGLLAAIRAALKSSHLVIVEGAIACPVIEPVVDALGSQSVRRVYLKRMSRTIPDYWADEDAIESHWPPTPFHRSIYQYHAAQKPWLDADLVLQRIGTNDE
jgi:hypothetical protein